MYHRRKRELPPPFETAAAAFRLWKRSKPFVINAVGGVLGAIHGHGMAPIPHNTETRIPEFQGAEGTVSSYKEVLKRHYKKGRKASDLPPQYYQSTDAGCGKSIQQNALIYYSTQSSHGVQRGFTNYAQHANNSISGYRAYGMWAINDYADINQLMINLPGYVAGKTTEFCIDYNLTRLRFSNNTGATAFYTVYDIAVKRDIVRDDSGLSTSAFLRAIQTPLGAVQQSTFEMVAAWDIPFRPGYQINNGLLFKDNYKIVKTSKIMLRPGGVHEHKVYLEHHKHMDSDHLNSHIAFKGFTHWIVVFGEGQPAFNHVGTTDDFAPCQFQWTLEQQWKTHAIAPISRALTVAYSDNKGDPPANLDVMNPETGTAVAGISMAE